MFNLKTLRGQGMAASAVSIVIFVIVSSIGIWGLLKLSSSISDVGLKINNGVERVSPLLLAADDVRFDVVQVQRWLTDVSATRGMNGLNEGMDLAAKFAKRFDRDTDKALKYAQELGLQEVVDNLRATKSAFPEYYNTGKKVARTYIDSGTAGGNKMMGSFDAAAERINNSIEKVMDGVAKLEKRTSAEMIQTSAVAKDQSHFQLLILSVFFVVGIILLFYIAYVTSGVLKIISNISSLLRQAQAGNLDVRILGIKSDNEWGKIQHNFNRLMDVTEAFVREVGSSMEYVGQGKYFRKILERGVSGAYLISTKNINSATSNMGTKVINFTVVADKFETDMQTVVQTVTSAATQLQTTAQSMENTATSASERATAVAAAAEEASTNVQTVAAAAEQLSSSIAEISRQVSNSSNIASDAVKEANQSGENVKGLANSAAKIGEVVELISDIADQTNLLALNATIEAARAGEAGKGFAVVASEVKNLANQTAKATEDIGSQVGAVQNSTQDAVTAMETIGSTIRKIDEAAATIASAVEQQGAATQEIARNVEQASTATTEVTTNIAEVTQAASETGHAASEVLTAAGELAQQGDVLGREMDNFLSELRKVI